MGVAAAEGRANAVERHAVEAPGAEKGDAVGRRRAARHYENPDIAARKYRRMNYCLEEVLTLNYSNRNVKQSRTRTDKE